MAMTTSTRDPGVDPQVADAILGPPQGPRAPEQAAAARPSASLYACLVIVATLDSEYGLGCRFELGSVARIGSAFDNDIVLTIDGVAGHHARIERRATAYHLVVEVAGDHPAPVRLGDSLVQGEVALQHGDTLVVGRASLELLEGSTKDALDEAYHECICRLTIIDGATGAFNQRYLNEALVREISRSVRRGRGMAVAVFKFAGLTHINTAAHLRDGDDALRAIARRLIAMQRPHDITARLGADELAVIMPDTPAVAAREWAGAIRAAARETSTALGTPPNEITVSAGIAVFDAADKRPADLVACARGLFDDARRACGDLKQEG